LTADSGRRRSPGGVFFQLLRDCVSAEAYKAIFAHKAAAHTAAVNARRRREATIRAISMGHAPPVHGAGGGGEGAEAPQRGRR
jgi:hypothetical protein